MCPSDLVDDGFAVECSLGAFGVDDMARGDRKDCHCSESGTGEDAAYCAHEQGEMTFDDVSSFGCCLLPFHVNCFSSFRRRRSHTPFGGHPQTDVGIVGAFQNQALASRTRVAPTATARTRLLAVAPIVAAP